MISMFEERIYERDAEKEMKFSQLLKRLSFHKYERLKERYHDELNETNRLNDYFESLIDFKAMNLNYKHLFVRAIHRDYMEKTETKKEKYISSIATFKLVQYMLNFYISVAEKKVSKQKKKIIYLLRQYISR